MRTLEIADLFCGAGGTSSGALDAARDLGLPLRLTAVNHWPLAVSTHKVNHPQARHVCASLDSINPRDLFPSGRLDMLWASPECTHHSIARGGQPVSDQSRATAWCVTRWAEALRPDVILVENVPEFLGWGPIGANGRPLASRKGETFVAWLNTLRSLGYKVGHRLLCAADYGDPTTRSRLFVQAVRGRRPIAWPEATHLPNAGDDLFRSAAPWRSAREVIDWSLPSRSIFGRRRPIAPNTLRRIADGLNRYGLQPFIAAWDHQSGSGVWPIDRPLSVVTTKARHGLCEPFLVKYYGTAMTQPISAPLGTVTTKDRFGLVEPQVMIDGALYTLDIKFRMLEPCELAAAQGFPHGYRFLGNRAEQVKQIGNAVPCGLARALVRAVLQNN